MKDLLRANDPEVKAYTLKAQRDVQRMLEDQPPLEGEDYGPWAAPMRRLLQTFEVVGAWGAQQQLALMLHERAPGALVILGDAVTSDGQSWREVLAEIWEEMQAEARQAEAEQRMRERLARTTGDSMADEILAMLREQALSRTDIYRRYSRNVSAERINDALFVLERLGWARWEMVSTGGRRREVWSVPADEEG
jgi:hypothetical protein